MRDRPLLLRRDRGFVSDHVGGAMRLVARWWSGNRMSGRRLTHGANEYRRGGTQTDVMEQSQRSASGRVGESLTRRFALGVGQDSVAMQRRDRLKQSLDFDAASVRGGGHRVNHLEVGVDEHSSSSAPPISFLTVGGATRSKKSSSRRDGLTRCRQGRDGSMSTSARERVAATMTAFASSDIRTNSRAASSDRPWRTWRATSRSTLVASLTSR